MGVYLHTVILFPCFQSFPHTRGGVPITSSCHFQIEEFSPHTWGCTQAVLDMLMATIVFPTHVGVYLGHNESAIEPASFPHTRGGVPIACRLQAHPHKFSPHTWGCTLPCGSTPMVETVFPTHVGVYLVGNAKPVHVLCFPHTRGGVPSSFHFSNFNLPFSPHTWGCTCRIAQRCSW